MKIMKIKKIKRLIKKAEFIDGIKTDSTNSGMLSIYKNPTSKEIEEAKSESNSESIRGTIFEDNTIYCWNGEVLHCNIPKQFVPEESFRFAYEMGIWTFDLHRHFTFEQGMNKFLKLKSTLSQFGEFNTDGVDFFFAIDNSGAYRKFNNKDSSADTMDDDCLSFLDADYVEHFVNYMNSQKQN